MPKKQTIEPRDRAAIALAGGQYRWGFLTKQERDECREKVGPIIQAYLKDMPRVELEHFLSRSCRFKHLSGKITGGKTYLLVEEAGNE